MVICQNWMSSNQWYVDRLELGVESIIMVKIH